MTDYSAAPYDVGKGKPPVKNQFKPGQSGNPGGRKRKRKMQTWSFTEAMAEIVNELMPIMIGGREVMMPVKLIMLRQVVNDALKASPQQRLRVFAMLHSIGVFDLVPADCVPDPAQRQAEIYAVLSEMDEAIREEDRVKSN